MQSAKIHPAKADNHYFSEHELFRLIRLDCETQMSIEFQKAFAKKLQHNSYNDKNVTKVKTTPNQNQGDVTMRTH